MAKRKKGYRRVYDEGTGKTKLGRRKEVDVYRPLTGVGKTLVKDITYKSDDSPRVKYTEREVTRRNKDGSVKSYKNIIRKNGKIVDEATTKKIKYKDGGPKVKQRRGSRKNYDNKAWTPSGLQFPTSESSHLMMAEYDDEINPSTGKPVGWVGFPSLFQDDKPYANDQDNWVQMSGDNGWGSIYEEAKRRGEVYNFGEDKEAALAFGEGSWKDQLLDEGIEVELSDEEVEQYKAGGYVLEELEEGGEDDIVRAQKTCPPLHIYDSKSQKCVLMTETQLAEYELKYIKDWADSPQHKSMLKKSLTKDYPNASDQEIKSYVNNVKNLRQKVVNPVMTFDYDDPDDQIIAYAMPILFQDYYNYVTDSEGNLISSDDDGNFDLANPNLSNPKAFMSALYSENDSMSPYLYDWGEYGKSVLIDKKTGEKIEGVDPNKIPNPNFLAKAHFNTLGRESSAGTYAHEFSHLQKMADDLIPKSDKLKIDNYSNVDKVYELDVSDNVESIKKEYNPKGILGNMYLSDKDLYENNFDKFKIVSIIGKRLKKENSNVDNSMPYDEFIKKYSKDNDFYSDGKSKMLEGFKYVARPAETVARLDAIRMFGQASGIYDPMTEPLTKEKFNKLLKFLEKIETEANPNQYRDLLEIYTKDQIFNMLNTISKNEETDNVLDDQYAKHGGSVNLGDEVNKATMQRLKKQGYTFQEI